MFDRFTDRAKMVVALARKEALRSQHLCLGTEHLLLGLIKEGTGVAANVLKNRGIDEATFRAEVEKKVPPGSADGTVGQLPFSPLAKKSLEYARIDSYTFGNNYIGTEHLLLGILRQDKCVAAQILLQLNVDFGDLRTEILELIGTTDGCSKCSIEGCETLGEFEVLIYNFDPGEGHVTIKTDPTCPVICREHAKENEKGSEGERLPQGQVRYPYTNRDLEPGFVIYVPIGERLRDLDLRWR